MDKIKTVKIKNPDGSVSEETYTISVDAKDVDMANGKELQETIGTIDIDTDGNIAEQLENLNNGINNINNNINNLNIDIKKKAYFFNTVADMKNADLKIGDYVCTLGYYEINDGGAAEYIIVSTTNHYVEILNNNLKAELIINNEVSPEQFGAYGDGIHDDTLAWQKAVDIGVKVKANHNIYLSKKITITKNIDIDCNNANFICNDNTLFEITGELVTTLSSQTNYTALNPSYKILDNTYSNYTGFAILKGTNNFQESRDYYLGGFVGYFQKGTLNNAYPIDVEDTSIEIINPITGSLKNIGEITHLTTLSTDMISINVIYGYGYNIENIIEKNAVCYKSIQLSYCLNCTCNNILINQSFESSKDNHSYILDFDNSSFCNILNSTLNNEQWHCITTGGQRLCYMNRVENCHLSTKYQYSYMDHDNARGTIIKDCVVQCVGVSGLGIIDNTIVKPMDDEYKKCIIQLRMTSEKANAQYTVKHCTLCPSANTSTNYCGVHLTVNPQIAGKNYYCEKVVFDDLKENGLVSGKLRFAITEPTSTAVIGNIYINNSVLDVAIKSNNTTNVDISNSTIVISNCVTKHSDNSHYLNIGGADYGYNKIIVSNSHVWRILGAYTTLILDNVSFENNMIGTTTSVTNLYGSNILGFIRQDLLLATTSLMINSMIHTDNDKWFNICNDANTKYFSRINNGNMVTSEITYNN